VTCKLYSPSISKCLAEAQCLGDFPGKVGEETLFWYFAKVAESVQMPVSVYKTPMLTSVDLASSLIARIASLAKLAGSRR
jgi:dihydrodipicolinate synthase/N-acetylneuraminate lyase